MVDYKVILPYLIEGRHGILGKGAETLDSIGPTLWHNVAGY